MATKIKVSRPTKILANEYRKEIKLQGYGAGTVTKDKDGNFIFEYWELNTKKKPTMLKFEQKT